jgi:O-antigen/teichoic acid export membrane protein
VQRAVLEGVGAFAASALARFALGFLMAVVPPTLSWYWPDATLLCAALVVIRVLCLWHQTVLIRRRGLVGETQRHALRNSAAFWRESLWYGLVAPVSLLMSGFDRFLVVWLGGLTLSQLAVFLAPQEIALRAIILPAAVVPPLVVQIARQSESVLAHSSLVRKLFAYVGTVAFVVSIAITVLAQEWAPRLFLGVDDTLVVAVSKVLIIGVFSNALAQFPSATLAANGRSRDIAVVQLLQLPVFVIAIAPLVSHFGVTGAALAWTSRIVADTCMLMWRANRSAPQTAVRGWQAYHAAGVLGLIAIGATW